MCHSRLPRGARSPLPNARFRFLLDPFTEEFAATGGGTRTTQEQTASLSQLMVEAALDYAVVGIPVIPLYERMKEPRLKKWPAKATTEHEIIEEWFLNWPDSNLGIVMGQGLIAVDVDPRHGGDDSLARLIEEHGTLPETAEARTGSGGTHYLFRVDGEVKIKNSQGVLGRGLDIKAEGGYLVAAPSVHPITGARYYWERHPREGIARMPEWLLAKVRAIQPVTPGPRRIESTKKPAKSQRAKSAYEPRQAVSNASERPMPDLSKASPLGMPNEALVPQI